MGFAAAESLPLPTLLYYNPALPSSTCPSTPLSLMVAATPLPRIEAALPQHYSTCHRKTALAIVRLQHLTS